MPTKNVLQWNDIFFFHVRFQLAISLSTVSWKLRWRSSNKPGIHQTKRVLLGKGHIKPYISVQLQRNQRKKGNGAGNLWHQLPKANCWRTIQVRRLLRHNLQRFLFSKKTETRSWLNQTMRIYFLCGKPWKICLNLIRFTVQRKKNSGKYILFDVC